MIFSIPGLSTIQWVAIALASGLLVGYVKGCVDGREKYVELKASVKAEGERAIQEALEETALREAITKRRNNATQAEISNLRTYIADLALRLSNDPSGSVLPRIPDGASVPTRECFDRAQLDAAFRKFTAGVARLVGEGQVAVVELKCGSDWVIDQGLVK